MDELAYARYIQEAKKADEVYKTIRDLYGRDISWPTAYYRAIKDRLLSKEEKDLVKQFHPIR
jgi:hypothetical protein